MKDLKAILDLLFLPEERCCPSSDKFSYHSLPVKELYTGQVTLVSPNNKVPIKKVKTEELVLMSLNPMKEGFRKDSNCSTFRNFLVEMDSFEKKAQIEYLKRLGLTYSAMIWSGSKSVHTLISLTEDLPDEKTYRMLYKWILNVVTLSDQALGNPSRSIRLPGAIRPETGNLQELIELKSRVKLDDLMLWLNQHPDAKPKEREERKSLTSGNDYDRLSIWAKIQLRDGIDFSQGRNRAFFALSCDLCKSGYSLDETIWFLEQHFVEEHDFKYKEFEITVKSAFTYVANKG